MNLTFEEVVNAYFDCRKRKRRTIHALDFEFDMEKNLFGLYEDLYEGRYKIGKSIAFVVDQPKTREIWAASFRDRVVHHLIYNRLSTVFYPKFIRNSFACIPERGTLDASTRLMAGMRSITQNWQETAYYLGADIRNYFVSIDKNILWSILERYIDEDWLKELTHQVVFHDSREDCFLKSKPDAFSRVPRYKSLWGTPSHKGLPIGNLTSQFFANVYLNELDQFVKHQLKAKYYFRYVDDFVILDRSPQKLNDDYDKIKIFLEEELSLKLHPYKKRIGLIHQGVDFVGYVHKPYRRYVRKRTVEKARSKVRQWQKSSKKYDDKQLKKLRDSMNSYFGIMKWGQTYQMRKEIGKRVNSLFIHPDLQFNKLELYNNKASKGQIK